MKYNFVLPLLSSLPLVLSGNPDGIDFWWTALGDSYASGVGSGTYLGGQRCLRYEEAYPVRMNGNDELGNGPTKKDKRLHQNVVCSGAEVHDVADYQMLDKDTWGIPSLQYGMCPISRLRNIMLIVTGERPRFGEPSVATLTIGGDDIDFPGILFNCILEAHIPGGGPPYRTCDDQREHSWGLIRSEELVTSIAGLIDKIVIKGRAGQAGDKFKLYVTGYGQFFNEKTTACNDVTFARTANPKDDGKPHLKMTQENRKDFNNMSKGLNDAIKKAVDKHKDKGVKFIDIDVALEGHRFCEEGIKEPDQDNDKLWLWHYPYNKPEEEKYNEVLKAANDKVFGDLSIADLSKKYPNTRAVNDAFYDAIDPEEIKKLSGGDAGAAGFWDGTVGYRAKLFHPQVPWHTWIEGTIIDEWKKDRDVDSVPSTNPTATNPERWSYTFHDYTGNLAAGQFTFFILPGRYNGNLAKRKRSISARTGPRDLHGPLSKRQGGGTFVYPPVEEPDIHPAKVSHL